jgi:sodium transport system permease protein
MRWSIIRLIFCRELRDQLRDRRTIFMIAVLPLLLYPVIGVAVLQFAVGFTENPSVIGICGRENLPAWSPLSTGLSPVPAVSWLTLTPAAAGTPAMLVERVAGATSLSQTAQQRLEYPPLLIQDRFLQGYFGSSHEPRNLRVQFLDRDDRSPLEAGQVELILSIPADFCTQINENALPVLKLTYRDSDDRSRLAAKRLYAVLGKWRQRLRETRLARRGLAPNFDEPFKIEDPVRDKPAEEIAAEGLLDLMVRIFPFLLVLWSLAGALYPAVDLCAGEKERGTMETLLISPASRQEIVGGKFLTIWVFSAATALLNLASMGITATFFSGVLPRDVLGGGAILWCVVLALPLSAFFSALCLAVGVYARSSKEGQYYLMPLFVITLPLIFLTLAPGVELNPFYSLVPVTGVALLMQRLMTSALDQVPWLYFIPVLAPTMIYSGLALRWAIEQFQREEVLFREAERLDIRLWLRRLFREKEALPSTGQAFFCFALMVALRWLTLRTDNSRSLIANLAVAYLAFVAAPPLIMAFLITSRPRLGLALRLPSLRALLAAGLMAVLVLPPLVKLTLTILHFFPQLTELLNERQPLVQELRSLTAGEGPDWWPYLLVLGVMPAVFEELAFRGFILTGLRRRFRPRTAILLSSVLFALYHMNVFQALPAFLLGVALALLAIRSGSAVPGMVFHLLYNVVLIAVPVLPRLGYADESVPLQALFHPAATVAFAILAVLFLTALGRRPALAQGRKTRQETPKES